MCVISNYYEKKLLYGEYVHLSIVHKQSEVANLIDFISSKKRLVFDHNASSALLLLTTLC